MRANYGNMMNMDMGQNMGQNVGQNMGQNVGQNMGQNVGQNDPGFTNMVQRFNQWRQGFQGNPQQMVQQMLNSGQMTQQQFGQLQQMARQIMAMMPR